MSGGDGEEWGEQWDPVFTNFPLSVLFKAFTKILYHFYDFLKCKHPGKKTVFVYVIIRMCYLINWKLNLFFL